MVLLQSILGLHAYTYPVQKNAITVKLVGGLGNQLFIWATAYSISKKRNLDLIIDASECTQSGFELSIFGIKAAIKPVNPPDGIFPTRFPKSQSILLKLFRTCRTKLRYLRIGKNFWERSNGFDPTVLAIPIGKTLRGYFQSYKYFEETSEEIRGYLITNITPSAYYQELLSTLKSEQWVAIHARRQDYWIGSNSFGLIKDSYYKSAIDAIEERLPKIKKYVFSDDIAQAKLLIPDCDGYIGSDTLISAAETILIMSQADAIIGANSSFSWWAAFLMKAEDTLKIFPEPWFIDTNLKSDDLVPPSWSRISVLKS